MTILQCYASYYYESTLLILQILLFFVRLPLFYIPVLRLIMSCFLFNSSRYE